MAILYIEKLGGLAGFGGTRARIRSRGQLDTEALSATDQQAVQALFEHSRSSDASGAADGFRLRISRATGSGIETVEVHEGGVPAAIASCVKDEFVESPED